LRNAIRFSSEGFYTQAPKKKSYWFWGKTKKALPLVCQLCPFGRTKLVFSDKALEYLLMVLSRSQTRIYKPAKVRTKVDKTKVSVGWKKDIYWVYTYPAVRHLDYIPRVAPWAT
jgi:hypothetical protein